MKILKLTMEMVGGEREEVIDLVDEIEGNVVDSLCAIMEDGVELPLHVSGITQDFWEMAAEYVDKGKRISVVSLLTGERYCIEEEDFRDPSSQ